MILVFGSLNADFLLEVPHLPRPGETCLGANYLAAPGGKGANQALAAKRAGAMTVMAGCVGEDALAALALRDLEAGGIDLSLIRRDPHLPTALAAIVVDAQGQNQIAVASGANRAIRADSVPQDRLTPATLLVLQMEVPVAENWRLAARAKATGARILLNAAPAGPIDRSALAHLDWLVVNEGEALTIARAFGFAGAEAIAASRHIAAAFGLTVIVTLGAAGAAAFAGADAAWRVEALPIRPIDTTGAGDAFVGALAAALDAGADLPEALRSASAAGGLACLQRGAQSGLPFAEAIAARRGEIICRRI